MTATDLTLSGWEAALGVLDDIETRVTEIAQGRGMTDDFAFGFWFLEDIEDLSQEEAELTVTGGPWDRGRDAVYYDETTSTLGIYQMKYSRTRPYVLEAFRDLQRGLQAEYDEHPERFEGLETLNLKVVTKYSADEDFAAIQRNQQQRIRTWLTRRGLGGLSKRTQVEVFDLRKFAQLMEKLYGVGLKINYREAPLKSNGTLLGLADARAFVPFIDREELLAFNIRKFLGIRTGSVNSKIKETLEDEEARASFWTFNNGIVCLCTEAELGEDEKTYRFTDFTIVNGAQTVSTISLFLNENPTILEDEPIWVVCKTMRVEPTDLDTAVKLTQTSNTQTPASGKDLRAVDQGHVRLSAWMQDLGVTYAYKRGGRSPRGADVIQMKDVAQAYVAYWERQPNVSFARAGSIFSDDNLYESVFPPEEMDQLFDSGSRSEQLAFARRRLMPVRLLEGIRAYLKARVAGGDDKRWKSLAYHMLYAYAVLLEHNEDDELLIESADELLDATIELVYEGLKNLATDRGADVPRDLKSDAFLKAITESGWFENFFGQRVRTTIIRLVPIR